MDTTIVAVKWEDIDDLIELMEGYFDFYKVTSPDKEKLMSLITELMAPENPSTQFISKVDDRVVGFVTLYESYSTLSAAKVIVMNDLFVDAGYRQRGIGKALFEKALDYTRLGNYPKMEWMTEPSNERAKRFYNSLGGKSSQWVYYSIS